MKILVTGGAGYIGSHTCKELVSQGHTPITFDSLARGHRWAVRYGPFEEGELSDRARIEEVLRAHEIEAVLHFAAYALVGESVSNPGLYYQNNFIGSLNLVEAMCNVGVKRLVFSSTCATYGIPNTPVLAEDHPQSPINPYGESKLMVEKMLRDFRQSHGLQSVALRYFNAAGADVESEIGEDHDPETHLIPCVMLSLLGKMPPLTIFGEDYPTPDGTCIRDYIHVKDLARAHILALEKLMSGVPMAPAYNLGTGQGISVRQIIDGVETLTGKKVPLSVGPRRAGDPPQLVADPSLAFKDLGWKAEHSELKNLLETAWGWHCKHHLGESGGPPPEAPVKILK